MTTLVVRSLCASLHLADRGYFESRPMLEGQIGAEGKHLRRGRATRWKAMEDRTDLVAGLQLHGQTMKGWIQSTMRRPDRSRTLSVYRFVPAFETFVLPFARNESGIRPLPAPVLVLSRNNRVSRPQQPRQQLRTRSTPHLAMYDTRSSRTLTISLLALILSPG